MIFQTIFDKEQRYTKKKVEDFLKMEGWNIKIIKRSLKILADKRIFLELF